MVVETVIQSAATAQPPDRHERYGRLPTARPASSREGRERMTGQLMARPTASFRVSGANNRSASADWSSGLVWDSRSACTRAR